MRTSALVELYIKKVKKGDISLSSVPPRWHDEVEQELEKQRRAIEALRETENEE